MPDPSGGTTIGTAWAEQVAYVLELGTSGDSIEIVWPDVELEEHAAQTLLDAVPVERLVFDGIEGWSTLADVFALAGGLSYVLGS